jgi:hypothetical protein
MLRRFTDSLFICMGICSIGLAQNARFITIKPGAANEMAISVDPQIHMFYGVVYPLTYEFSIPRDVSNLLVYKRHSSGSEWTRVVQKTSSDFFNAIDAVRIEYASNKALVSVGFGNSSDSIFVKITDTSGQNLPITFNRICKYYDNRAAVVSCSADDYATWNLSNFLKAIRNFRNKRLWLSVAVNTAACSQTAFDSLQVELDRGYIEAGAHSRTHPNGPFVHPDLEITGCKEELIRYLSMPPLFRNGDREYVYTWIAPYGYNDQVIDSLLGLNRFLANRLYYLYQGSAVLPEWDQQNGIYRPFGVTREVGPAREGFMGTGDSTDLNNAFDLVVAQGGIYFLMCHPSIVEWDKAYTWSHLEHVSNHNDIWYVSIGHLFVYHFAQGNYEFNPPTIVERGPGVPPGFLLQQNHPNPFNPSTSIQYTLPTCSHVTLTVFNTLGQIVGELVNGEMEAGYHTVQFDASGLSSGAYFYRMRAGDFIETKHLLLLR